MSSVQLWTTCGTTGQRGWLASLGVGRKVLIASLETGLRLTHALKRAVGGSRRERDSLQDSLRRLERAGWTTKTSVLKLGVMGSVAVHFSGAKQRVVRQHHALLIVSCQTGLHGSLALSHVGQETHGAHAP